MLLPYNLPAMNTETDFNIAEYPHVEYLADPAWLTAHRDDANLVVVDLDAEAAYLRGHIPGAVFLDNNYERNPETGWVDTMPPARFAAVCQELGIDDSTLVVAYDNSMSLHAARFWWTLIYYGHRSVKVLDGCWRRWVAEGGPIAFDRTAAPGSGAFTPRVDESLIVGLEEVQAGCSIGGGSASATIIWDTRTLGEFSGAVNRGNRRAGHIAGAVHRDWQELMDRDTHRFKPAAAVRQLLAEKGITPDKVVYAY